MKQIALALIAVLTPTSLALALCPMCKKALENSAEGQNLAAGFNAGILLLLATPFLVIGAIGFFVYRAIKDGTSEKN
ncbi:MAG: hypothetical protein QW303_08500 [Nitrososphaerota archaeon]